MLGLGIDVFRYGGVGGTPFEVTNSLIFTAASSQYGLQTFGTPTDATKWTLSTWLKIDSTGASKMIFTAGENTGSYDYIMVNATGAILVYDGFGGGTRGYVYTGNVVTSTDTWYHLCVKFDGSAASSSRVVVYLDGVAQSLTVSTAWPSGGGYINTAFPHGLGVRYRPPSTYDGYHNGHLCETFFVDGQSLTPSSFYDSGSPIAYTGTFGNNGFYLDYKDGTSTTTLGYDVSGNDNHWTLSNMTTANQSTDVPA